MDDKKIENGVVENKSGQSKNPKKIKKSVSKEETSKLENNTNIKFDIDGKLLLVRVGDSETPASSEEIEEVENKIVNLLEDNGIRCAVLVTHHAVSIDLIEPASK